MAPAPILLVDHATALGGAEVGLLLLLELLDRTQFTPHLVTQAGRLADAARTLDVTVHVVALPRLRGGAGAAWHLARASAGIARIIRRERIALVVSNTMRASFYATLAARLTGRPLVWQVRDIFAPGLYVRAMGRLCDAAIAISRAVAEPLPCRDKVQVIVNGVRAERFAAERSEQADRLRAVWGVPPGMVLIGQVARLQPWKGQRDVLAAAARLRDLPTVRVAIVGGDIFGDAAAYAEELEAMVRSLGLTERVIFAGHHDDVPSLLPALDIVVHASDHEPFGRILIEAGAAGVPVVAYASGAVSEIVVHEGTGLLVPPGDPVALAAGLRRLAADLPLARRLGANARAHVRDRFDAVRLTRDTEEVFRRVLSGGSAAGPSRR